MKRIRRKESSTKASSRVCQSFWSDLITSVSKLAPFPAACHSTRTFMCIPVENKQSIDLAKLDSSIHLTSYAICTGYPITTPPPNHYFKKE